MDGNHKIPFLLSHGLERVITEDTSIGNENVNDAELLYGNLNNLLSLLHGTNSRNSLASSCILFISFQSLEGRVIQTLDDFIDNSVSSFFADIIDNDIRAKFAVH